MKGSGLAAARRPALGASAIAVAGCLALSACSGSPGGAHQAATTTTTPSVAAQKFCREVTTAFHTLDGYGITPTMSLAGAHADVDKLMKAAITGFGRLATEAPAAIQASVRTVVADFRSFKAQSDKASSVAALIASSAHGSPTQTASYHGLLAYTARTC
jgi:hypothetical protein